MIDERFAASGGSAFGDSTLRISDPSYRDIAGYAGTPERDTRAGCSGESTL
jgi:hypothetical protein